MAAIYLASLALQHSDERQVNMGKIIQHFRDGSVLEYDSGSFDEWCVYLTRPGKSRYAPRDTEYFREIKTMASIHTEQAVYADFVKIYQQTGNRITDRVLEFIQKTSEKYLQDALEIEILFTVLYSGMVAEQNKKYSKLGKRVKRLGIHQVILEDMSPVVAANFSKNKPWREIDSECKARGF